MKHNRIFKPGVAPSLFLLMAAIMMTAHLAAAKDTVSESIESRTAIMLADIGQWDRSDAVSQEYSGLLSEIFSARKSFRQAEPLLTAFLLTEGQHAGKRFLAGQIASFDNRLANNYATNLVGYDQAADYMLMALGHGPDTPISRPLRRTYGNAAPQVQAGILNILDIKNDQRSMRFMIKQLRSEDPLVVRAAISALGGTTNPKAVDALVELIETEHHPEQLPVANALLAIASALHLEEQNQHAASLFALIEGNTPYATQKAAATAGLMAIDPAQASALLSEKITQASPGSELRGMLINLIDKLPETGRQGNTFLNIDGLTDWEKVRMVTIMARYGEQGIRETVMQFIEHENQEIRFAAIAAFSMIANADDVPMLAQKAASTRDREQEIYRNTLNRLPGTAIDEAIINESAALNNNAGVEMIRAMAERNMKQAVGHLLQKAGSSHQGIRIESYRSLGRLADADQLQQVVGLLTSTITSRERQELERTIFLIMTRDEYGLEDTQIITDIINTTSEMQDKASLISVLGNIKNQDDLPVLLGFLNSEHPELQLAATRALTDWPDSAPADGLHKLAASSNDIRVKTLAIRAYNQVIISDSRMSNEMKAARILQVLPLAPNINEKRQVIAALTRTPSFEAFEALINELTHQELKSELELAITTMAPTMMRINETKAKSEIQRALRITDSTAIKQLLEETD